MKTTKSKAVIIKKTIHFYFKDEAATYHGKKSFKGKSEKDIISKFKKDYPSASLISIS